MIVWSEQPTEVANLFNPAFLGELTRRTSEAYVKEAARDMPLVLAFVSVPLALYPDSRRTLNARQYGFLHSWITANPQVRVAFPQRCRELAPYVRLGLAFAIAHGSLAIGAEGGLRPMARRRVGTMPDTDTSHYFVAGRTLGRWFARVEQDFNIFVMLGVEI